MNNENALSDHLRALEERMTQPEIRTAPAELAKMLADDFREFGGSGRVFDKGQIIDALKTQAPVELWLDEFQAMSLAPEIVLVTYRGNCRFPDTDRVWHSLRSSIWRYRDGSWKVVFHQGTPAADSLNR